MKGTTLTAVTLAILYLTTPSVLSTPIGRRDINSSKIDLNIQSNRIPIVTSDEKRAVKIGVTDVLSADADTKPNPGTKRNVAVGVNADVLSAKVDGTKSKPDTKRQVGVDVDTHLLSAKVDGTKPKPDTKRNVAVGVDA